ncbi:MAG: NADH-ubiquinone oxidoreductase [Alteromonadaceae bacterium]|nr:NADH-ubiquinone oxidoreductase [Alteromonadaceae bacterium]
MTQALLAMTVGLPLLLSLGFFWRPLRAHLLYSIPFAGLPGLLLALVGDEQALQMPWLLEGATWAIDDLRRTFLGFSSLLWTLSGVYSLFYFTRDDRPDHFALFWLLSLAGNLGLIIALDIASFYSLFALMTFAAYGLVAHNRDAAALEAGRVYMIMALLGEMALLAGLIMAAAPERLTLLGDVPAAVAVSPYRATVIALLFTGFGVKAGAALLHLWLPLAHPAAPTPASAVLSGAMIKAGLFGWLYTLPGGEAVLPGWGLAVIVAGLVAAFGAALLGVCQQQPKAVLAYSSISQMGLITVVVGAGLAAPEAWPTLMASVVFYAMHHGLTKGALFLSAGTAAHAGAWPRWLFWVGVWLPGLSLTGLVLTSGATAKGAFKTALHQADIPLAIGPSLATLLSAAAVATTLLVARYSWCLRRQWGSARTVRGLLWSWLSTTFACLLLIWCLPRPANMPVSPDSLSFFNELTTGLSKPVDFLWPPALGLLLAGLALTLGIKAVVVPAGDLIVPLGKLWRRCLHGLAGIAVRLGRVQMSVIDASRRLGARLLAGGARVLAAEQYLRAQAGLIFAVLVVFYLLALVAPDLAS